MTLLPAQLPLFLRCFFLVTALALTACASQHDMSRQESLDIMGVMNAER